MATTRPPFRFEPGREARRLTDQLVDSLSSDGLEYSPYRSDRTNLSVADVENAIDILRTILYAARRYGTPVPCIVDRQGAVPIAPRIPFPRSISLIREPYPYGFLWEEYFLRGYGFDFGRDEKIEMLSPDQVQDTLEPRLFDYLTVRFEWAEETGQFRSLGAAAAIHANNPYLPFEVRTKTSGLRIHYSKNFLHNYDDVFGSPSTPVNGWIRAGIHRFAGVDNHGKWHYDHVDFTTPPLYEADLNI